MEMPGFIEVDSMPLIEAELKPAPPTVPIDVFDMSDDECLLRLAQAIEEHDTEHLDEVARLIARLAVPIE